MRHELKIWLSSYQALQDGRKTAELRLNDRDYQVGDVLELHLYDPFRHQYMPAHPIRFQVTHLQSGFGLEDRYVMLSLKRC
jgi:hypothetical protein